MASDTLQKKSVSKVVSPGISGVLQHLQVANNDLPYMTEKTTIIEYSEYNLIQYISFQNGPKTWRS